MASLERKKHVYILIASIFYNGVRCTDIVLFGRYRKKTCQNEQNRLREIIGDPCTVKLTIKRITVSADSLGDYNDSKELIRYFYEYMRAETTNELLARS